MITPKISIIVPCYNVEKYLPQCMDSLFNQTLQNIEIILVNDGSPDSCPILCDEYATKDTRVKVIHKKNGGLGLARNSGMELATGKYIAFLDSDDFVDLDMYRKLYEKAESEDADVCYCGYSYYNGEYIQDVEEGIRENMIFKNRKEVDDFLFSMIGMPADYAHDTLINMCVWRAIYRLEIIRKYSISFISERVAASEDVTFHASFLPNAKRIYFLTEHLYRYRYNPNSISHSYPEWKRSALMESCRIIAVIFAKHYSKDKYITCYRRHLFRNLKTIIRKEAQRNSSLWNRYKDVKKLLKDSTFVELFSRDFEYHKLPTSQQVIYLLARFRCALLLILLVKIMRK